MPWHGDPRRGCTIGVYANRATLGAKHGWTPEALRREWEILGEEIEVVVRKALPRGSEIGRALELLDRFLDRARRISRRSLAYASTPGSP
jgi:hypothetical protein